LSPPPAAAVVQPLPVQALPVQPLPVQALPVQQVAAVAPAQPAAPAPAPQATYPPPQRTDFQPAAPAQQKIVSTVWVRPAAAPLTTADYQAFSQPPSALQYFDKP